MKNISQRLMGRAGKKRTKHGFDFALCVEQSGNTLVIGSARRCNDGVEIYCCFALTGLRSSDVPGFVRMFNGSAVPNFVAPPSALH